MIFQYHKHILYLPKQLRMHLCCSNKVNHENIDIIDDLKNLKTYFDKRLSKKHKIILNLNKNDSIKIKGDKILLFWAFENIIKNSIDAIEQKNGQILINVNKNKNKKYTNIDFIDNGKGVSRKQKRYIFRPGYSTKSRGWGLGLSLTKRIIQIIHSGQIQLVSSNKKETIFRVLL